MTRRAFLGTTAAASAGLATLGPMACRPAAPATRASRRLGAQLYTVRSILPGDFEGVLRRIREIGYEEVEFAGYHGRSPSEVRAALDVTGLAAPSSHVGLDGLRADLEPHLHAAEVIGHRYLVVPWIDAGERRSLDGYRRIASELNDFGDRLRAEGRRLAYHNHDFEFDTFGGEDSGYDVLLEHTEPELVTMQMDVYWMVNGGRDPFDYFERHPGRFELLHLKDRAPDGRMVDVGAGAIDFARIFELAERAGVRHAFVEHDEPENPLRSLAASYSHLETLPDPR